MWRRLVESRLYGQRVKYKHFVLLRMEPLYNTIDIHYTYVFNRRIMILRARNMGEKYPIGL